jgi:hypothetical protein
MLPQFVVVCWYRRITVDKKGIFAPNAAKVSLWKKRNAGTTRLAIQPIQNLSILEKIAPDMAKSGDIR